MNVQIKVPTSKLKKYIEYQFTVAPDIEQVEISYSYERLGGENVVDFALKSQEQFLGATGGAYSKITLANDNQTSPGYPIGLKSEYTIVFRVYKVSVEFEIDLNINFITKERKLYIADLHNHTLCSDGVFTIDQIDKFAVAKNIDIIGITDHFAMNASRYLSDSFKTQMLLGMELTMQWGHMGIYGLPIDQVKYQFQSQLEVQTWLEQIKAHYNVFRIINHPYGNCEDCDWKLGYEYEALEVFNSFDINNNIKTLELYQQLLEAGNSLPVICGSDTHMQRWHCDDVSTHGLPANKVAAYNKSQEAVLEAISNYRNECSYYPQRDIVVELDEHRILRAENLPVDSFVKVFTEDGEIKGSDPIVYHRFIRFEVWQKSDSFTTYIEQQINVKLDFEFEWIPVYATNPKFLGE